MLGSETWKVKKLRVLRSCLEGFVSPGPNGLGFWGFWLRLRFLGLDCDGFIVHCWSFFGYFLIYVPG